MHNDYSGINDEAAKFTTKEDRAAMMRDEAAVELARQIHEWSKDNLNRYDHNGNDRVNFGELDLGTRVSENPEDVAALRFLQDHYKEIQRHSQNKFLFIKGAGGVSVDGIGEYAEDMAKQREENAKQLSAAIQERALQAGSREIVSKMMATSDGNANNSLFRVIDSIDGDIDNEISKKDLNRYLDEYQKRARYGDIGSGFFTAETRRYVEHLRDNWDTPEMVRLRGTWTRRDHDGRDEEVPNSKISEESLKKAIGVSKHKDMFEPFIAAKAEPAPKFVEAPLQSDSPDVVEAPAKKQVNADTHPAEKPAKPVKVAEQPKPIKLAEQQKPVKAAENHSEPRSPIPVAKPALDSAKDSSKAAAAHEIRHSAKIKPQAKAEQAAVVEAQKPVARPALASTKTESTPKEVKPAQQAKQEIAKQEKPAEPPSVVEADEAHKLSYSPWKTEPQAVVNMVAWKQADAYFSTEEQIAKLNAASVIRDNEAVAKAVELNEWGKDNIRRYDTTGDNRVNYGELDLGARTSKGYDQSMLRSIQDQYQPLQDQSGGNFLFIKRPDAISQKDLQVNVEKAQEMAEANEMARQQASNERRARFENSQILTGLLATPTGNPNQSLFRVIDGMDNDIDDEISRRDLRRYLDEYQKRARYGDVGRGFFSTPMRQYVEYMNNNWDSPAIKNLRGTYTDNDHRERAHDHINLDRLRQMLGMSRHDDIFQRFSLE